ncbi:MAG: NADH:ubiquinone reductase (Na(+)-transporting) subunit C [Prevotella sp.]|nr:NADH:ubiquinone reductase (Na(+)-transporting) subunit C [Prevotella sp.]
MTELKKKGLNKESNTYIILYSTLLVVIVAFLLAYVSQTLKPIQDVNVALDKKRQILAALNIDNISNEEVSAKYSQIVVADKIIDTDGRVTDEGGRGGERAAFVLNSSDYKAGRLGLFVCDVDGATKYVLPVYGMGLWGPIWGYIAIDSDKSTVYGAYFNHESETAGLGAEIKDNKSWRDAFRGKKIFADDGHGRRSIALAVRKPADIKNRDSEVDAITGATLTSNGVSDMFSDCLGKYIKFLNER